MFKLINNSPNTLIHDSKRLVRPKVSPDVRELLIFKEKIISVFRIEHERRRRRDELRDGAVDILESLLCISKLAQ